MKADSTPFDVIKKGDWVAVVGFVQENFNNQESSIVDWNGRPGRVLACSWPFLAVRVEGNSLSIDTRAYKVQIVSKEYARAMRRGDKPSLEERIHIKNNEDGYARCVRCGERLRQRLDGPSNTWRWVCPECSSDSGPVDAGIGGAG